MSELKYQLALPCPKPQLALPAHVPQKERSCLQNNSGPSTKEAAAGLTDSCASELEVDDIELFGSVDSQYGIKKTSQQGEGFCYHLGALLFAPLFVKLKKRGCDFIIQWLVSVLLGAKNVEQTKILHHPSLAIFLASPLKSTKQQRLFLKSKADKTVLDKLQAFNIEMVGISGPSDFYYDPHTKHYTGIRNILKGWCSKIRIADKVLNMDFIHTKDGFPVYLNIIDNFEDLRERFFMHVAEFRKLGDIGQERELTFIIDRAIFSQDVFNEVAKTDNLHLVTWEKNYGRDKWDSQGPANTGFFFAYAQ